MDGTVGKLAGFLGMRARGAMASSNFYTLAKLLYRTQQFPVYVRTRAFLTAFRAAVANSACCRVGMMLGGLSCVAFLQNAQQRAGEAVYVAASVDIFARRTRTLRMYESHQV